VHTDHLDNDRADLEPIDLTAPPRYFVELEGSSDPDSLNYGGPLNLLPVRLGFRRPCSLHPSYVIGTAGCPRCQEIFAHRGLRQAGANDG